MSSSENANILVVDDEPVFLQIYSRILGSNIAHLHLADNKTDALEAIQRRFFHAAILDIRLANFDPTSEEGMHIAEAIYSNGESTGVILISGFGTPKRVRDAFRMYEAVDFLGKENFNREELSYALSRAISKGNNYVELCRQSMLEIKYLIRGIDSEKLVKTPSYPYIQDFERVLQYLVSPLLPIIASNKYEKLTEAFIFETRYWSRYYGNAYTIKVGPRTHITELLDTLKRSGKLVESYTRASLSGIRYVDESLLPTDF